METTLASFAFLHSDGDQHAEFSASFSQHHQNSAEDPEGDHKVKDSDHDSSALVVCLHLVKKQGIHLLPGPYGKTVSLQAAFSLSPALQEAHYHPYP